MLSHNNVFVHARYIKFERIAGYSFICLDKNRIPVCKKWFSSNANWHDVTRWYFNNHKQLFLLERK